MKKQFLAILLAGTLTSSMLAGCGSSNEQTITLEALYKNEYIFDIPKNIISCSDDGDCNSVYSSYSFKVKNIGGRKEITKNNRKQIGGCNYTLDGCTCS